MMKTIACSGCEGVVVLLGQGTVDDGVICPNCCRRIAVPQQRSRKVAAKVVRRGKPAGSCGKCGKVFFKPQGIHTHVKHCKG